MSNNHPNEKTTIIIQPSSWKTRTYDTREEESARRLIREEVLLKRNEPYYQVRAKIKFDQGGKAERIVAYMLRANSYTADVVELQTNEAYGFISIKEGPDVAESDDDDSTSRGAVLSIYADVDMVCGTPVPDIPTAKQAVERVAELAQRVGLRVQLLLGDEATVGAYQSALTSGIRAFYNVGHGYTGGIVLHDGNLTALWCSGLTGRALSPAVTYFNSCQVFNPPLQPAIMDAGSRTFMGGIVNLLIGPSEQVSSNFWQRVLENGELMGPALRAAEQQNYPTPGAHGVSGDLGLFGSTVNQVIFYEHANYAGRSRALGIGRYDLNQIGLPNDCISSLRVPTGIKVTLFQHAGFTGNSITFTDSASFVGSFNDQTSSFVIEPANNAPAVDIYEHNDFQGMRKQLGIGRYNVSDIGLPNDCLSSIRVGPGLKATLFEHKDFTGSSVSYVRDTSSVGSFNDRTSSIIVEAIQV
ncbi:MAG TPA: beta/gamma crystallin-related protein, partial [Candidatus Competibacteraceae bacterium]|nr:beta/gamma crystallin-related protein [Candidatus Competibacteraceae bacterium]